MCANMLRLTRQHFEVFRSVIPPIAIEMMDDLSRPERPSYLLFSDNAMLVPAILLNVRSAFTSPA